MLRSCCVVHWIVWLDGCLSHPQWRWRCCDRLRAFVSLPIYRCRSSRLNSTQPKVNMAASLLLFRKRSQPPSSIRAFGGCPLAYSLSRPYGGCNNHTGSAELVARGIITGAPPSHTVIRESVLCLSSEAIVINKADTTVGARILRFDT